MPAPVILHRHCASLLAVDVGWHIPDSWDVPILSSCLPGRIFLHVSIHAPAWGATGDGGAGYVG